MGRASATGDIGTHAYHLVKFVTGLEMTQVRADFHVCGAPKAMEDTAFLRERPLAPTASEALKITCAISGTTRGDLPRTGLREAQFVV